MKKTQIGYFLFPGLWRSIMFCPLPPSFSELGVCAHGRPLLKTWHFLKRPLVAVAVVPLPVMLPSRALVMQLGLAPLVLAPLLILHLAPPCLLLLFKSTPRALG
jgi:hypothetical protein